MSTSVRTENTASYKVNLEIFYAGRLPGIGQESIENIFASSLFSYRSRP